MKEDNKANRYFDLVEQYVNSNDEGAPYKCKMCGIGDIPHKFEICRVCGWQDDVVQNMDHDYEGGANKLSFNQYKSVWISHKESIMKQPKGKGRFVTEIYK